MALLSTLVKAVADIEGLDEAYVSGVARYLREAGLVTQAGRGRGAAHMSTADAVNLLIGVNTSPVAKASPEAVKQFSQLRIVRNDAFNSDEEWSSTLEGDDPIDQRLRKGEMLHNTLCALVVAYTPDSDRKCRGDLMADVFIRFTRPSFGCIIEISDTSNPDDNELYAMAIFEMSGDYAPSSTSDRAETVTISQRTLRAVGQVLAN